MGRIAVIAKGCDARSIATLVQEHQFPREQVTILGYIEPVAGPLYAVFLVGQLPTLWTVAGGALILAAGLLIVIFGRGEGEASVAAAAEPEPL